MPWFGPVVGLGLRDDLEGDIHDEFGDGIMSEIDFDMTMEGQPDQKGDRVKLVLPGKFLPHKRCIFGAGATAALGCRVAPDLRDFISGREFGCAPGFGLHDVRDDRDGVP